MRRLAAVAVLLADAAQPAPALLLPAVGLGALSCADPAPAAYPSLLDPAAATAISRRSAWRPCCSPRDST